MTSRDKIDIKFLCEVGHNVFIKCVTDTSLALSPVCILVILGICPQDVANQPLVRNVCWPLDHLDVPVVVQLLTATTVHAQDLVVDESSDW